MESSEIRKRVLHTLERARRNAASHRDEADQASRTFAELLPHAAAVWKQASNVLRAENHAFTVQTPAGLLRFTSDRSADDFVEVTLDTARRPVAILARTRMTRGRRVVDRESLVAEGTEVATVDEVRLLDVLLTELEPLIEK
jgi:hypothetical protein